MSTDVDKLFGMIKLRIKAVHKGTQTPGALHPVLGWLDELSSLERTEIQVDHGWKLGISEGLSQAANYLLDEATRAFKRGDDSEAKRLRNLSTELSNRSKKAHPGEGK